MNDWPASQNDHATASEKKNSKLHTDEENFYSINIHLLSYRLL